MNNKIPVFTGITVLEIVIPTEPTAFAKATRNLFCFQRKKYPSLAQTVPHSG